MNVAINIPRVFCFANVLKYASFDTQSTMPDYRSGNISRHLYGQFFENPDDRERLPLTLEERELAAALFPIVDELVTKHLKKNGRSSPPSNSVSLYHDPGFKKRIALTRENLKTIILMFSESDVACKKFMAVFESCEKTRVENISKLRAVGGALDKDRENSNISQITGSSVGAVGCAVIASSLIFPPLALALAIGGGIAAGLGAAVTVGTTVTEGVLIGRNVTEAKSILEEDRKQFVEMEGLFTHSIDFVAAVEQVLSMDLMKSLAESLRGLTRDSTDLYSKYRRIIRTFLVELCQQKQINETLAALLPIVITAMSVLFVLRQQRHVIYDIVMLTTHLFYAFTNGLELGVEMTRVIAQIFMRGGAEAVGRLPANVARVVFHGVFAGLGIALDVINIIYSAVDLSKGSKSEHAVKINNAADALEKELNLLREIHKGIEDILSKPRKARTDLVIVSK